ncbi:hypothetical protein DVH24_006886 [Malus domestica]|uniref:Uncharacterized protein n=1 Tax=Malus domestica TaxID=3750 RepID=A0A498JC50_MALDO|nr:hypothetical protein DVH24_006886 [Malus domestica]
MRLAERREGERMREREGGKGREREGHATCKEEGGREDEREGRIEGEGGRERGMVRGRHAIFRGTERSLKATAESSMDRVASMETTLNHFPSPQAIEQKEEELHIIETDSQGKEESQLFNEKAKINPFNLLIGGGTHDHQENVVETIIPKSSSFMNAFQLIAMSNDLDLSDVNACKYSNGNVNHYIQVNPNCRSDLYYNLLSL